MAGLSVVIPALEEASQLPLLLADLHRWPGAMEIVVVDAASRDPTVLTAQLGGARVLHTAQRCRGSQLRLGVEHSQGNWLLMLHADSRLSTIWMDRVLAVIAQAGSEAADQAWTFDFRVDERRPMLILLEWAVALRSRWLQRPYGDQGLLIHRSLYNRVGGYQALPLMEDLDLIERISAVASLGSLNTPLVTSARRWKRRGVLAQAWRNAMLRHRWRQGETPEALARAYRT